MTTFYEILAVLSVTAGLCFMLLGALGIVRMPDVYLRLHAASKCSTLGLAFLLLGAVFHTGDGEVLAKSIMVMIFAFVANPVGNHILAKAALQTRARQWRHTLSDEYAEDHAPRK